MIDTETWVRVSSSNEIPHKTENLGAGFYLDQDDGFHDACLRDCNGNDRYRFTVRNQRIVYRAPLNEPYHIVKFVEPQHSLHAGGASLSMGTVTYYGGWDLALEERTGPHIDQNESITRIPEGEISIIKPDGEKIPVPGEVIKSGGTDLWILCMSMIRLDRGSPECTIRHFADGCKTCYSALTSSEIDRFAYRLGIDYGNWAMPRIAELYMGKDDSTSEMKGPLWVTHGPVVYMKNKNDFLLEARHKRSNEALLAYFIKDDKYAIESEYRFVVGGWGVLKRQAGCQQQLLLPVSHELGDLFPFHGKSENLLEAIRSPISTTNRSANCRSKK